MLYYDRNHAKLFHGNCLETLDLLPPNSIDVIFADPPYFLSNGGSTCKNGKWASVNKGKWDVAKGLASMHGDNHAWLSRCQRLLKPDGTIWISGTHHVIFSIGFALQEQGFKILNQVTWIKPNPPPNLACRYFTHSTETIIWAAKSNRSKHFFNYKALKEENGNKQMKDVWNFTAPSKSEKIHGHHPTQKPISLLNRIIKASAPPNSTILDPFNGSGTTAVAALTHNHSYIGMDLDSTYLDLTIKRIEAIPSLTIHNFSI